MGCNTSKESVQPAVDEAKEDSAKNGDISKVTDDNIAEKEKDKDTAATKIQAAFRGHHARKSLRAPKTIESTRANEPSESEKQQLQAEFPADDQELCNAVTKIQASFRGLMSRKEQAASAAAKSAMSMIDSTTAKIEDKMQDAVNELQGIDLADPDLHKAATKIQASFRGHKVRQEVHSTADPKE